MSLHITNIEYFDKTYFMTRVEKELPTAKNSAEMQAL